ANTFIDPDVGQTLTYTARNLPLGITFDGPSHTFVGTAPSQGTYTMTIIATDNGAPPLSASCTFQLTVGHPPSCSDGVKNGTETGVDCGGPTCPPCVNPPVAKCKNMTVPAGAGCNATASVNDGSFAADIR